MFSRLRSYILHFIFFFFNATSTTEIYTLSLHDALPICGRRGLHDVGADGSEFPRELRHVGGRLLGTRLRGNSEPDRKSTRLNSSHEWISYAVFCLKKKKNKLLNRSTSCL